MAINYLKVVYTSYLAETLSHKSGLSFDDNAVLAFLPAEHSTNRSLPKLARRQCRRERPPLKSIEAYELSVHGIKPYVFEL